MYCPLCKHDTNNLERIIIARTDKIGDLVLSIPSFYMARKMYPNSKIAVLVRNYNYNIVKYLDFIDEVIKIDDNEEYVNEFIKNFKADAFIALFTNKQVAKLAKLSGAKIKVGALSKPHSWITYNAGVYQKRSKSIKNEAEYNLDLIRSLNKELFDNNFEVYNKVKYTNDNIQSAQQFIKNNNVSSPFILIHPFDGGSAKNLTLNEYKLLINKIKSNIDIDIVVSCTDNEYEKTKQLENAIIYKASNDILDFAALVDLCSVFMGASTGTTHIAGALGKQVVAIYPKKATQSPTRWGLYSNKDNTTYIIPDSDNEDYSHKSFDNITDDVINDISNTIISKVKNG